jgi:hypothetical protein
VTLVMGMDQHRAQSRRCWLDTETGEVSRARVAGGPRWGPEIPDAVRGCGSRGCVGGDDGWRFVVEELPT